MGKYGTVMKDYANDADSIAIGKLNKGFVFLSFLLFFFKVLTCTDK
jgi:hypothetical protein